MITEKEHQYYRRCTLCDPDLIVCPVCNGSGKVARSSSEDDLLVDEGTYPFTVAAVKEAKEMIPILEFSSAEHRDIRPGYPDPEPSIFRMHEVDRHIRGTFCATSGANIPDHADEIKFVIDSLIITLKHMKIWSSSNTNGNKIVSSAPIDARCKRVYYTFEASSIEYDTGEEQEEK